MCWVRVDTARSNLSGRVGPGQGLLRSYGNPRSMSLD